MNCPRCENINFVRTDEITKPVIVHRTEYSKTFNKRTLVCLMCGHVWETTETFTREIEVRGLKITKIIENAKEIINEAKRNNRKKKHFNKNHQGRLF